ncbi:hypothetical protein TNCV_3637641 [Trichonephila clavipes]|nr:hypothetical protein TNCV_3637641 [Trichonephila clavipes]
MSIVFDDIGDQPAHPEYILLIFLKNVDSRKFRRMKINSDVIRQKYRSAARRLEKKALLRHLLKLTALSSATYLFNYTCLLRQKRYSH